MDAENTIAFMGRPGANADLACRNAEPYMHTLPCDSFEDVFAAVEDGRAKLGMIPIENSQAGRVAEIHNLLPETSLHIVGEYFQQVRHHLAAPKGATLESIKEVYSHNQALMQCRKYIHEMKLTPREHACTATAAEDVSKWNDAGKAAICSALAVELYGLETLQSDIQDADHNITTFVKIAREPLDMEEAEEGGRILTTLLFTIRNIPAALYKCLGGFATNGVNMLKLESYIPGGTSAKAQFFITFEGNPKERAVQLALEELGFFTQEVKVLGIYPADAKRFE